MSCNNPLRIGEVGISIQFQIYKCVNGVKEIADLTGNSSIEITFQKINSDREVVETIVKSGVIFTGGTNGDATDGLVHYVTEVGFLDVEGKWKAQAKVTFPDSTHNSSIVKSIKVEGNLQ